MNYQMWVSLRYLQSKKDRILSVINFISIAGVAIGVMALIVVIGVMTGFDKDLREKIIGANAHVVVEREIGLADYEKVRQDILPLPGVVGATAYVHGSIFLEAQGQAMNLGLRGIDAVTDSSVTKISEFLTQGQLNDLVDNAVIIGSELARYFGYRLGDEITLIAPASGLSGEGWRYTLKIVGVFNSGVYDYDMNLVLVNLKKAQEIFALPANTATGIGIKVDNIYGVDRIKAAIHEKIGYGYLVRTWIESNRNFFAALKLEKFAMFVILTLIVLVASFNIVSTLIVTVTNKVKDIGILKSIGVPARVIRQVFTLLGLFIGMMGTFWGLVGGLAISFFLKKYQFIKLPQDIYYLDHLPIVIAWTDVATIITAALLISFLATIYPAAKAANLQPVEALRYE